MEQRYGTEVWNRGMERILQTGMERRYGTGVWNGCGPGPCSGRCILTRTHIYIYIYIMYFTWKVAQGYSWDITMPNIIKRSMARPLQLARRATCQSLVQTLCNAPFKPRLQSAHPNVVNAEYRNTRELPHLAGSSNMLQQERSLEGRCIKMARPPTHLDILDWAWLSSDAKTAHGALAVAFGVIQTCSVRGIEKVSHPRWKTWASLEGACIT